MDIRQIRSDMDLIDNKIHLNNAGSSLPPRAVTNRIIAHLTMEGQCGGYEAEAAVSDELNDFYRQAACLINATPDEISYHESATHAWQKIFYSIPLKKDERIIVFQNEYASYYISLLQQRNRYGCIIDIIPMNDAGDICLKTLKERMGSDVKMVLLGHMPTQSGQLSPAEEVGAIVKPYGSLFILDATQTIGQYHVDVKKINCDALCATGRKFLRGPRGTGFLYVRQELARSIEPYAVDLKGALWVKAHSYQLMTGGCRFETWEQSIALKLGLKEAIKYANEIGIKEIWQRGQMLAKRLRAGLSPIAGITLCDPGSVLGNIITFTLDGIKCDQVVEMLSTRGISINKSQRIYARLDFEQRNLEEVCRASPHYFNTEQEIDTMVDEVRSIALSRLRAGQLL
jgi:cysteine desulfurase/selenocysteine lyase